MGRMNDPPHPGEILREDVIKALGLSVTEAARMLGVSREALSRILHGKAGISPEMALSLSEWLGASAESWLGMQAAYDLWMLKQQPRQHIEPLRWKEKDDGDAN